MRRTIGLAVMAALLIGSVSCSKEIDNGAGNGAQATSAFQFSLQTAKGALITYADIATAAEWNYGDVSVFIYDKATGALIGQNSDFDIASVSGNTTLTAKDAWTTANKGKSINVYFVGNNAVANLYDNTAQATGLATEAEFIEQLTEAQKLDGEFAELLKTPLLFSASALDVLVPSANKVTVPVTLKRREARFDIVNPVPADFVISKVVVRNANLQGFIFADATTTPTLATGKLKEIDCSTLDFNNADNLAASVFYLYPTQLGVGSATEIAVIATMSGGVETSYPVNSTARIEANKRYKLVFDEAKLIFDLVPADYDEGAELAVAPMDHFSISGFAVTSGPATYDHINGLVYVIPGNPASTVSFTTFASTAAGVEITMTPFLGTGPAITTTTNTTESTITYSNIGFKTNVTINIDTYTGNEPFQTVVKIKDIGSDAYDTFLVLYDDGNTDMYPHKAGSLQAVKIGDLYWAPVNVGATAINKTYELSDIGYFFQWGRNVPLKPKVPALIKAGPVTYEEAHGLYKNYFITAPMADDSNAGHWLDTKALTWNETNTPCPEGWRLPTKTECEVLVPKASGANKHFEETVMYIVGDDLVSNLYFPLTGRLARNNGIMTANGASSTVWTSTQDVTAEPLVGIYRFILNRVGKAATSMQTPATAMGIRCVKNAI